MTKPNAEYRNDLRGNSVPPIIAMAEKSAARHHRAMGQPRPKRRTKRRH